MSFLNGARWINGLFAGILSWTPTANRSIALPNASGSLSILLVSAQQNTAATLTSSTYTLVPFPTETADSSNLFTSGIFTPTTTGIYRISCNLFFSVPTGAVGLYAAAVFQSGTAIGTIFLNNATGVNVGQSGHATLQLTAGTAYEVRAFSNGTTPTISIGSGILNSLTIEQLI